MRCILQLQDVITISSLVGFFALGKDVKVTGPDDVVKQMKKAANEFVDNYK